MSLEQAFLRALEENPRSKLGVRVKKAIRGTHQKPELDLCTSPLTRSRLSYRLEQIGRRWVSYRLAGSSWVGPIETIRADWAELRGQLAAESAQGERGQLLMSLVKGLGACRDLLDRLSRDYLVRLLATRNAELARASRVDGLRWFSNATLLVEAINDLEGHSSADAGSFARFLGESVQQGRRDSEAPSLPELCEAIAAWSLGATPS